MKKDKNEKVKRAAVSVMCVSLVCLCALLIIGEIRNKPITSGTMGSFYGGAEGSTETEEMVTIHKVDAGDFFLTGVYSPKSYDITVLDETQAAEHLGKKLDFSFLPDYLKASKNNSRNEIYLDKTTGKVVDGGITFTYWNEYGEDKLPIPVGSGGKGISLRHAVKMKRCSTNTNGLKTLKHHILMGLRHILEKLKWKLLVNMILKREKRKLFRIMCTLPNSETIV